MRTGHQAANGGRSSAELAGTATAMNTNAFNLERIREALKGAKEGCPWQRLVDLGYREWQKPENRKWSYGEMAEQAGETYGEVVKLLILLGACHHQVCNGGWIQYFDNGYASEAGRRRGSDDRRRHRVYITSVGREALDRAARALEDIEDDVLQALDADERANLWKLLTRAVRGAEPAIEDSCNPTLASTST